MKNTLYQLVGWLLMGLLLNLQTALGQNLALNKSAYASSTVQAAANAFDGNGTTRWESNSSDPQYLIVDLGSVQTIDRIRLTWENAYGKNFTLDVSTLSADPADSQWSNVVGGTWTTVQTVMGNTTTSNEYGNLGASGRYVRMYGTVRGTTYGYSLYEMEVFNYSNNTANNLAVGKTPTASSTQGGLPAAQAFDNDNSTRWGSSYADNQWIYVDLNGYASITQVYLIWETAYGKDFRIEVSNDASNWTTVSTVTGNTLHYNEISFSPAVSGRYVRMYGVTRGTGYGFSLYEFQVYGTIVSPLPVSLVNFRAAAQANGVALNWTTASELHNAGFEVQRSVDGVDFAPLGFVAGAGTTPAATTYHYLDAAPLATTSYYRLQQRDLSGAAVYSPTVAVEPTPSAVQAASIYPNPATTTATLSWRATAVGTARYSLLNSLGQVVRTQAVQSEAGANTLPLDLSACTAGSYVLLLEAAGQPAQRTRVLVRK